MVAALVLAMTDICFSGFALQLAASPFDLAAWQRAATHEPRPPAPPLGPGPSGNVSTVNGTMRAVATSPSAAPETSTEYVSCVEARDYALTQLTDCPPCTDTTSSTLSQLSRFWLLSMSASQWFTSSSVLGSETVVSSRSKQTTTFQSGCSSLFLISPTPNHTDLSPTPRRFIASFPRTDCSESIDSGDLDKFAFGAALGGGSAPSRGLRQALMKRSAGDEDEDAESILGIKSKRKDASKSDNIRTRRSYYLAAGFVAFYPVILFLAMLLPNTWEKFTKAEITAWVAADQGQTIAWVKLDSSIGLNVYDDVLAFYIVLYVLGAAGVSVACVFKRKRRMARLTRFPTPGRLRLPTLCRQTHAQAR